MASKIWKPDSRLSLRDLWFYLFWAVHIFKQLLYIMCLLGLRLFLCYVAAHFHGGCVWGHTACWGTHLVHWSMLS